MPAFLTSRYLLWLVLAAPLVYQVGAFVTGRLFYGEVVHASGELSVRLLIVAMAATPLALMFPGRRATRWLMKNRRYFGVASFAYALVHTIFYLDKTGLLADIIDDALTPGYGTGWVALLLLAVLALTSNDASVRWLKSAWRRLHRLVYVAAVLTFAHWLLVAFNPAPALAHLALLAALEAYRIWRLARLRASARTAS